MSIRTILEYYAIISLASFPLAVFVSVMLYKKTNLFKMIDAFLDRILGIKESTEKIEPEEPEIEKTEAKKNIPVPAFYLEIGDTYYCHSNGDSMQEKVWSVENDFVGEIKDGNVFHAEHAGTTKVLSSVANQAFDSGNVEYEIEVLPTAKWFADTLFAKILKGEHKMSVIPLFAGKQTREIPGPKELLQVEDGKGGNGALMQFAEGKITRCLYVVRNAKDREGLVSSLSERFEKVELTQAPKGFSLWSHSIRNEAYDNVDAYAFLFPANRNEMYLGIGRVWRKEEDIDEFLMNISMTVRLFSALLPQVAKLELKAEMKDKKQETSIPEPIKSEPAPEEKSSKNNPVPEHENHVATTPDETEGAGLDEPATGYGEDDMPPDTVESEGDFEEGDSVRDPNSFDDVTEDGTEDYN